MNRKTIINIHLILSCFFLPYLLMMPATGFLYLIGEKGNVEKELIYTTNESFPSSAEERKAWIATQFERFDKDYTYEYIRSGGKNHILRPTSRIFYSLVETDTGVEIYKSKPNLLSKLIELHKGHGPGMFKKLEIAFGFFFLCIVISGLWLALSVKAYRSKTFISFGLGILVFIGALLL